LNRDTDLEAAAGALKAVSGRFSPCRSELSADISSSRLEDRRK
jgi:hypothetical protein